MGPIFGEGEKIGGDSREERLELFGLRIEAVELAAAGEAGGEELLTIFSGNGSGPGERTGGELNGLGRAPAKEAGPLIEGP